MGCQRSSPGLVDDLDDDGHRSAEIAVADPGGARAKVGDAVPLLAVAPIGESVEVNGLHAGELVAGRLIGDTFVLHGAFVAAQIPADDERHAWVAAEILCLPRARES